MACATSPPFFGGFLREEVVVLLYLEHESIRLPADPSVVGPVVFLSSLLSEVQEVQEGQEVQVVQVVQELQVVLVVLVATVVLGAQEVQEVHEVQACVPHGLVQLQDVARRQFEKNMA